MNLFINYAFPVLAAILFTSVALKFKYRTLH